jgi:DNA-binding CsgD family transcriptional regulator
LTVCGAKKIETFGELGSLKACLNDLMAILALPALWNGRPQDHVLRTLLDAVRRVLELDFVYAQLHLSADKRVELIRAANIENTKQNDSFSKVLKQWLDSDPATRPHVLDDLDGDKFALAAFRLGYDDRTDLLVAGSRRVGFPTESERLLLNVAADQAIIGLREAQLVDEQRKVTQELDLQVSRREGALEIAADELKKENEQRKAAEQALRLVEAHLSDAAQAAAAAERARASELAQLRERYAQLTTRERQVLPFVVAGQLSKQTAAELGTSEITIRVHRGHIMRKMHAHSLAELIRMADKLEIR